MVDHKTLLHNELRSALTRHGPCFTSARNAAPNPHPGVSTVSALRVRRFAVLSALGTLVWAAPATAQGCAATACRATNEVHATVGTIMRLTVNGSTTVVASSSSAAYAAGRDVVAGPTAIVKSNGRWKLQISAAEPTWAADAGSGTPRGPRDRTADRRAPLEIRCRFVGPRGNSRLGVRGRPGGSRPAELEPPRAIRLHGRNRPLVGDEPGVVVAERRRGERGRRGAERELYEEADRQRRTGGGRTGPGRDGRRARLPLSGGRQHEGRTQRERHPAKVSVHGPLCRALLKVPDAIGPLGPDSTHVPLVSESIVTSIFTVPRCRRAAASTVNKTPKSTEVASSAQPVTGPLNGCGPEMSVSVP